jgi:hypothetical protein
LVLRKDNDLTPGWDFLAGFGGLCSQDHARILCGLFSCGKVNRLFLTYCQLLT